MLATRVAVAIAALFAAITSAPFSSADAPKPNQEMKEVLSALEALGPKPIESIARAEAARQPASVGASAK